MASHVPPTGRVLQTSDVKGGRRIQISSKQSTQPNQYEVEIHRNTFSSQDIIKHFERKSAFNKESLQTENKHFTNNDKGSRTIHDPIMVTSTLTATPTNKTITDNSLASQISSTLTATPTNKKITDNSLHSQTPRTHAATPTNKKITDNSLHSQTPRTHATTPSNKKITDNSLHSQTPRTHAATPSNKKITDNSLDSQIPRRYLTLSNRQKIDTYFTSPPDTPVASRYLATLSMPNKKEITNSFTSPQDTRAASRYLTSLSNSQKVHNSCTNLQDRHSTSRYLTSLSNKQKIDNSLTNTRDGQLTENKQYGVDTFLTSFHTFLSVPHNLRTVSSKPASVWSSRSRDCPSKMVIAIDKVVETVAVVPRPSYQQTSVYSHVEFSDHRRHKVQIDFRPVLHPVRYSDTAYIYINNTRKRFVSRTFYEPRVRPQIFSDTTFNNPKTAEHSYVTYLDHHVDENRKWFKTCVEIKAKNFTSAQLLLSQNNNYINTSAILSSSADGSSPDFPNGFSENGNGFDEGSESGTGGSFHERYDPGASQVFIPKRKERPLSYQSLTNGDLILNFPNSKVDMNFNGVVDDDYSEA